MIFTRRSGSNPNMPLPTLIADMPKTAVSMTSDHRVAGSSPPRRQKERGDLPFAL
jgi:hypothetical protein